MIKKLVKLDASFESILDLKYQIQDIVNRTFSFVRIDGQVSGKPIIMAVASGHVLIQRVQRETRDHSPCVFIY